MRSPFDTFRTFLRGIARKRKNQRRITRKIRRTRRTRKSNR